MGIEYGYARVSSQDQNEFRQLAVLLENGIPEERIFVDKTSGKDFERPQYQAMLTVLRPCDRFCVASIDRLSCRARKVP